MIDLPSEFTLDIDWPADGAPVTIDFVKAAVAKIADAYCSTAHAMEDKLHRVVLKAIAEGTAVDPKACATAALATLALDFERWYD